MVYSHSSFYRWATKLRAEACDAVPSNCLFLFCGRRRNRIKALMHEPDGYVLLYKRLTGFGAYRWPRNKSEVRNFTWKEFEWLIKDKMNNKQLQSLLPWSKDAIEKCHN